MPLQKEGEEMTMGIETICCVVLILLCLGVSLFAKKTFYFSIRPGTFGEWYVRRWPNWMFPFCVWLIRVGGIVGVAVGVWLLLDKK